jgi:hypothetical protein
LPEPAALRFRFDGLSVRPRCSLVRDISQQKLALCRS